MTTVFHKPQELLDAGTRSLGTSDWFTIEQGSVTLFVTATGDHPWNQLDGVVPGYMLLSLVNLFLPQLIEVRGATMGVNVGCGQVRFPATVHAGARIRGRGELTAATMEKGGVQAVVRVTIEVEGGTDAACVVDTISRYFLPTP